MGKERYYYWSGKSSKRRESGKAKDNSIINNNNNSSSGCMSAVFQFFDFHPFHFGIHHHQNSFKFNASFPQEQEPSKVLKGAEAPRNSLELEEASFSSFDKDNDNLAIPIGIQIKTRGDRRTKSSQEITSSSPGGAKTPTLVARLMGLDLLPETTISTLSSPRPSSTLETPPPLVLSRSQPPRQPRTATTGRKSCSDSEMGTRSLPETPRISLGRRSDVDLHHHHRLSLQIDKENMNSAEDLALTRLRRKSFRNDMENSRRPSYYAKQIVKQVKENVSRRVGLDITNLAKNTEQPGNTQVVKFKKPSKTCSRILEESSPGKHETTSSYSPRTRFGESIQKNQKQVKPPCPALHILQDNEVESSKTLPKPKSQVVVEENRKNQEKCRSVQKCRKVTVDERFKRPTQKPDFIKSYKQEETFVPISQATRVSKISEKKCRKSPVPTLLPAKKDPSPPATKIPTKQPQQQVLVLVDDPYPSKHHGTKLSHCSSQRYHHQQQEVTHMMLKPRDTSNGATTTFTVGGGELQYISSILECTGIDRHTQLSLFTKCFSPTHPLDPSIFNQVENSLSNFSASSSDAKNIVLAGPLGFKCNRKLIFDLVNEILIDILKPHIKLKPWLVSLFELQYRRCQIHDGSHLVDRLCARINKFPCADCQVLEDIDALVDLDIEPMKHYQITRAFEEVGDFLATEIERDILDTLIQETTMISRFGM